MVKSLDDLIRYLIDEIALCGEEGMMVLLLVTIFVCLKLSHNVLFTQIITLQSCSWV